MQGTTQRIIAARLAKQGTGLARCMVQAVAMVLRPGAMAGSGVACLASTAFAGTVLAGTVLASPALANPAPVDLLAGGPYETASAPRRAAAAPLGSGYAAPPYGSSYQPGSPGQSGLPYLECVPYARKLTGIDIHGDAYTWWDQAAGRYARGYRPKVGAVMSFRPYGAMQLGHVAAVSRIVDSRTLLLRHANWSPIEGQRGRIEEDVRAVDVSPANDWSAVRVWYAPLGDLGTTHWPVNGFIYNSPPDRTDRLAAISRPAPPQSAQQQAMRTELAVNYTPQGQAPGRIGADFLKGIVPETRPAMPRWQPASQSNPGPAGQPRPKAGYGASPAAQLPPPGGTRTNGARLTIPEDGGPLALPGRTNPAMSAGTALRDDPIGRIIAARVSGASR